MELSSPESIRAVMRAKRSPSPASCRSGQLVAAPVGRDRRIHCKCGQCDGCLESARWERIFTQKFADPDYYTCQPLRHPSPLASV